MVTLLAVSKGSDDIKSVVNDDFKTENIDDDHYDVR